MSGSQTASRSLKLPRLARPRAEVAVLVAALLLLGYYAWTVSSSGDPFNKPNSYVFHYKDSDYYALQANAFLHGHLWLDVPVDPRLAAAPDPYDPNVQAIVLGDASFYHGRYYLTWGPAPAVTTYLPFRLAGIKLRDNLAVLFYSFIGVIAACASLALLLRRLRPEAPRVMLWSGWATIALAGAVPFILRRPAIYEVALTGAFCFGVSGFYLLLREATRRDPPRMRRLAMVGVLFGLATLTRATFGPVAVAMAGLAYLLRHDGQPPLRLTPTRVRAVALVVGIPAVAGALFMVYNAVRFSGPMDFGNKYQMAGRDVRFISWNSFDNLVPAAFGYLVAPLRIGLEFPFVHLPPPPDPPIGLPNGFGLEPTGSIFWSVPLLLLAVVALGRAGVGWMRDRATLSAPVTRVVAGLVAIGAIPLFLASYAVPGYTERYEIDFLPYLAFAAVVSWAELARLARTPLRAAFWRWGGMLLVAYGVIVGVAIGFTGYYDDLKTKNPKVFQRLERLFSPLSTEVAAIAGHPIVAGVSAPAGPVAGDPGYTTLGVDYPTITLRPSLPARMTIISPDRRTAQLSFTTLINAGSGRAVVTVVLHGGAGTTTVADRTESVVPLQLRRGVNYVDLRMAPVAGSTRGKPLALIELQALHVG